MRATVRPLSDQQQDHFDVTSGQIIEILGFYNASGLLYAVWVDEYGYFQSLPAWTLIGEVQPVVEPSSC